MSEELDQDEIEYFKAIPIERYQRWQRNLKWLTDNNQTGRMIKYPAPSRETFTEREMLEDLISTFQQVHLLSVPYASSIE